MTTERMKYFAKKYLEERVKFWEGVCNRDCVDSEARKVLDDYRNELNSFLKERI